jgi:glycosyltransferase involved in cell wall biosynthesis
MFTSLAMQKLQETEPVEPVAGTATLPISVIVPVKNEAHNLARCLNSLKEVGEVYVIDSQSSDETAEIARSFGAKVVQFHYAGGWPKKRQWAMDMLPFAHDWIFLVDADEALTPELAAEIRQAIKDPSLDGCYVALRMFFLGRALRHGDAGFCKLSLFRHGHGHFECRLKNQDASMADMEVHEHVIVTGKTWNLCRAISKSTTNIPIGMPRSGSREKRVRKNCLHRCSEPRPSVAAGCAKCFSAFRDRLCCFSSTSMFSARDFWMAFLD